MPHLRTTRLSLILLATLGTAAAVQAATAPVPVPAPTELARERHRSGSILWTVDQAWTLLIPGLFVVTGFSAGIRRQLAVRLGSRPILIYLGFVISYLVLVYLIDWPLRFYGEFLRPHAYGLSTQPFDAWQTSSLKALGVGVVNACALLWIPFTLMRKTPRTWWLWTGLLLLPFALIAVIISPIVIDPLFNHFEPMQDRALEAKILALAHRAGMDDAVVLVADKSRETRQVNAYVTGLGGTKRIVLWDTLLQRLDEKEILFVVGHEMGHYVLDHVFYGSLVAVAIGFIGLWLLDRLAKGVLRWADGRFGFDRIDDIAALPLLIFGVVLLRLVLQPVGLIASRHFEHEADRFGLELTEDNHAAAESFVNLQQKNLSVPWPGLYYKIWRGSHPALGERIEFCNTYFPWALGEPLRYGAYFRGKVPNSDPKSDGG